MLYNKDRNKRNEYPRETVQQQLFCVVKELLKKGPLTINMKGCANTEELGIFGRLTAYQ